MHTPIHAHAPAQVMIQWISILLCVVENDIWVVKTEFFDECVYLSVCVYLCKLSTISELILSENYVPIRRCLLFHVMKMWPFYYYSVQFILADKKKPISANVSAAQTVSRNVLNGGKSNETNEILKSNGYQQRHGSEWKTVRMYVDNANGDFFTVPLNRKQ